MKGFKDTLPDTVKKWQLLEETAKNLLESFGYSQIRTPIIEKTSLFERGVGDATDIVEKEMYTFLDKSGESVTLRPEGTAGIARAFIENKLETSIFNKLYYIGPMFRYERPQKGRLRQFHQIGAECFGIKNPAVDAEIVYINKLLFEKLNIKANLEINNIGCPLCRPAYSKALIDYFKNHEESLCADCQKRLYKNPLRILDCKNEKCKITAKGAPRLKDYVCENCQNHYNGVKECLDTLNIEYVENDMLVRGLDYYTSFVFELVDTITLSAGGRYDNLIADLGGNNICGVGFALGQERLIDIMDIESKNTIGIYIANLGVSLYALKILQILKDLSYNVYCEYDSKSLKSMLKKADKLNATVSIIVGEEEFKNNTCIVRNMKQSSQEIIKLNQIESTLKGVLYAT
ncbi:Histidyl-tRNA synthetase [Desulfurella amilsii]|uniref:Histidine--tRNA ligase n=1 Tax=Desulfurella amilsii TaxID=1562698 RepID=A0A1X4XWE8_9BACT|nr:histidine--tRNA ligase [Desulfurella amilsii]OSS41860.1 Histidyl-tRNA synthetase [Desulfurella amilsii]